jgi:transcriptional regulator with XRE-family HTH domain
MSRPNRIKAAAASQGRTVADVADCVGVSRHTLYAVATGAHRSWPKLRRDTSRELGVPEDVLFPDDETVAS